MGKNFLFGNGFKTFMKLLFLAALLLNAVRNEYIGALSVPESERGFLDGIQLVFMTAWIVYMVICSVNKENPFRCREE